MTFANPLALLWGLLAVPVVILYLRRIRLRREPVATGMFWERVFAEQPIRSAWQWWRHPASLAVQLIVLTLIVTALADPQIPGPRQIVLIIDGSASMDAADVKPTRLAEARQAATRLIGGLRPCDRMAVLSASGAVGVSCSPTSDQTVLRRALDELDVSADGGSTHVAAAVELARWMPAGAPRREIKVITDGCFDGATKLAGAEDVELIRVGKRTGNLAITRLQVRRTIPDPPRCQILAEVSSYSDKPVECRLELAADGKPLRTEKTNLSANGRWQQVLEETIAQPGRLTARLDPGDLYPADNRASRGVPPVDVEAGVSGDDEPLSARQGSRREGDLRAPGGIPPEAAERVVRQPGLPPWLLLIASGVLLLTLEWCLYQRRWVC